jgi:hypothetical protein
MVFILGRMGNSKQALSLLMRHTRDVQEAINFCAAVCMPATPL